MENVDYLGAFRRRWPILVVALVVGLGAGVLSHRLLTKDNSSNKTYSATAVLLGSSDPGVSNLATLAGLTTVGQVPARAAHRLNYSGSPFELAAQVSVNFDQTSGRMYIQASADQPLQAQLIANTFAKELIQYLGASRSRGGVEQADRLKEQMGQVAHQISSLGSQIVVAPRGTPRDLLVVQRNSK